MRPAGDHHIGIAPAEDFHRFANRLRRSCTRRQAVKRRPAGTRHDRQMRQRHIGLLLQFPAGVHARKGQLGPFHRIQLRPRLIPRPQCRGAIGLKIQRPLARPEVDAHPIQIQLRLSQPRSPPCLGASAQGKLRVSPGRRVPGGIGYMVRKRVPFHLGREPGRKSRSIENSGVLDTRLTRQ